MIRRTEPGRRRALPPLSNSGIPFRSSVGSVAVLLLALPLAAPASPVPTASEGVPQGSTMDLDLDPLLGRWEGEGTLLGREARFTMEWESTPVEGVYRLSFTNAFSRPDGEPQPVLSAEALYRVQEDSVSGRWFDSRGVEVQISGRLEADHFRAEWEAPTEAGVTVYRWSEDGVTVADSVRVEETLRGFGSATYRRVPPEG